MSAELATASTDPILTSPVAGSLSGAFTVRESNTIREIDRATWERLAGDNPAASYGWLKSLEETALPPIPPRYFLAEESGRLLAAAVCQPSSPQSRMLDALLFGRLRPLARALGLSLQPALLCSPLRGRGDPLLFAPELSGADKRRVAFALLERIEAYGRGQGLPICLLPVQDRDLECVLEARGYRRTSSYPEAIMDIRFSNFSGYLDQVAKCSRNVRSVIRGERNRNRRAGVTITPVDPFLNGDKLFELADHHCRRLNGIPFPHSRDFFSTLKRNLGDRVVVYGAHKEGDLTGVCALILANGVGWLPVIGVDHETAGNDFTYFNLAYYRPIEDAANWGLKRLLYGRFLYDLKRRRGCRIMSTALYYRSHSWVGRCATGLWFTVHRWWFGRKFPKGEKVDGAPDPTGETA